MNLNEKQLESRNYQRNRIRGRRAVIRNPYFTDIPDKSPVIIDKYDSEHDRFIVAYGDGFRHMAWAMTDELNLTDSEYSGHKLMLKGVRTERKDKFGDNFCIELISNKRDIYISSALASLLNLNKDENYVGFAFNPDIKTMYIFNSDSVNGYLYNKTNGRITSPADCRELQALYPTSVFKVNPQSIIDEDNPGFVFYGTTPDYNYYYEPIEKAVAPKVDKVTKKQSKNTFYKPVIHEPRDYNWAEFTTSTIAKEQSINTAKINIEYSSPEDPLEKF